MNNFGLYVTPEQAKKNDDSLEGGRRKPLKYYKALSRNNGKCMVCEQEEIWKLADTGMCFSCTTGESDASNDIEIIEER